MVPLLALVCAAPAQVQSGGAADVQAPPSAGVAAAGLRKMLSIEWKRGPDLPQGFQDSDGGIVRHTLITVCGFCSGQTGVAGKETKYPRGFLRRVWGLDLGHPANGWQALPDFPGAPRQELFAIVVGDRLYAWGGFSYSAPFCYQDGYQLSWRGGRWTWDPVPPLPWPLCSAGICAIGSRIYVMGGADYDANRFYTNGDRRGGFKGLGARLLVFDAANPGAGWRELPPCPGTPRWVQAMAAARGRLYVIGGATGTDNRSGQYCTVVDNWSFDPASATWQRLADTPIATGNFPAGAIVFRNRYVLLVGGYQYADVLDADGALRRSYGKVFKHYAGNGYDSDVLVFDTRAVAFGAADPLPLCNNLPMTVLAGDELHLLGGETGGSVVEGEPYGHHPDLYLIGKLRVLP